MATRKASREARSKTNCEDGPDGRSTAGCSRVAPRLRSVPRPRCNDHPLCAAKPVPLHVKVGAASKTTLAERGGYTHARRETCSKKTVEDSPDGQVNGRL